MVLIRSALVERPEKNTCTCKIRNCDKKSGFIPFIISGTAVGKLLTLGGVGIWWIVDIILLVTGVLRPVDGSNWEPYY